jgi:hypothetical protein
VDVHARYTSGVHVWGHIIKIDGVRLLQIYTMSYDVIIMMS